MIRMDYLSFDDYSAPIAAGEGPLGKYVEWYLVHLPRLHPHLGQVAGRQECGAASNGKEPLRPRAGGGDGLVSAQPASAYPRPEHPFDRDDAGPLCLLRHLGQHQTIALVRRSGREDLAQVVVAAGSRESAPLEPIHCAPKTSPSAGSPDCPSLHLRERNSSMKNRKRESCTSSTLAGAHRCRRTRCLRG